mmetsp:Transcript_50184/g.61566  ORF Transcript_50184/g.61566 Transcript_50184/m.61566 type:complete len:239 (-) Transcript_50184:472-1188(-)
MSKPKDPEPVKANPADKTAKSAKKPDNDNNNDSNNNNNPDKKPKAPKKKPAKKKPPQRRMMARMITEQSGRDLLELYQGNGQLLRNFVDSSKIIDRDLLVKMLKYENKVRLMKDNLIALENEALNTYENEDTNVDTVWVSDVIERIQRDVVEEFGYVSDIEIEYALNVLRSASYMYPNDKDIMDAVYYLKYNKAKPIMFKVGDTYRDVKLLSKDNGSVMLSKLLDNERPNIVLAGSTT